MLLFLPLSISLYMFLSISFSARRLSGTKVGIIYHDLKPENILLAADGHVKVMSWICLPGHMFTSEGRQHVWGWRGA